MSQNTPQMQRLCRALENYDGEVALAKALGVSAEDLSGWLAGGSIPPDVYFRTLAPGVDEKRRQEITEVPVDQANVLTDVQTLRRRARQHIEEGAVTSGYGADRETVLKLLNDALATEIVCVLRYRRHYFMAKGIHSKGIADEFLAHSGEELGHADQLAERIVQLGGEPNFSPAGLMHRSHAEYVEGTTLLDMIREDLVAERIAIDSYRGTIGYLGDKDPTTRRLLESILAVEEQHADELADLLQDSGLTAKTRTAVG
jgi:bacterioferritin